MPLVNQNGKLILLCINGCELPKTTKGLLKVIDDAEVARQAGPAGAVLQVAPTVSTMRHSIDWHALTHVKPPQLIQGIEIPEGTPNTFGPMFAPNRGTPVRLFICVVCGYAEMYAGKVTDPAIWGGV